MLNSLPNGNEIEDLTITVPNGEKIFYPHDRILIVSTEEFRSLRTRLFSLSHGWLGEPKSLDIDDAIEYLDADNEPVLVINEEFLKELP